jgi:autotransporter-associated beta strand protein
VSQQNRIVVFAVGGVININSAITVSANITIAGQTAPGDGITVYGNTVAFGSNVICRYIRFHGSISMGNKNYTLSAGGVDRGMFDHVSVLWGRWDNMKLDKNSKNISFQYCLVGEAILPQNLGALFETPSNVTVHHSLWINNKSRNPKGKANIEYINNVIYNWGSDGFVGGHSSAHFNQDIIANYFIAGPSSGSGGGYMSQMGSNDHVYHRDNYVDRNANGVLDGTLLATGAQVSGATISAQPYHVAPNPVPVAPVTIDTAAGALEKIIAKVGASNRRDPVDVRLIGYLTSYGTPGNGAIIQRESDVGGQPAIAGGIPPADTNATGIPDWWAEAMGNAGPATIDWSKAEYAPDAGYTNLEHYINSIVTSGLPDAAITGITPASGTSVPDPVTGGSITNDTVITLQGTAPAGATVQISSVDGSIPALTATADGSGDWTSESLTFATPRYYAFTVRVDRGGGAYSLSSAAYAVHVKTAAPAAPVIDRFVVGATEKTFSGVAEPYSTVTVLVTGGSYTDAVVATATTDGYGNWEAVCDSLITFTAAQHSFTATSTDLVGNVSAVSDTLTLDMGTASPVFTAITPDTGDSAADQITTSQTLTLNGTAPASAPVTLYRLDTVTSIGATTADASGDWTFDYTATTLPEGKYTFLASAGSGTPSAMSAPFVVTIDLTEPTVASIRRSNPDTTNTFADTLTYSVTFAEPVVGTLTADNFTLTVVSRIVGVDGVIGTVTRTDDTTFNVEVTGVSGDGTVRLDLKAVKADASTIEDLAGNKCTAAYTSGQTYTMRYVGSGVWNTDEDRAWSDTDAWLDATSANAPGATADFGDVDIEEETTVTLDTSVTLGRMIFGDVDEDSAGSWIINSGASSPSITLANPGNATPEIRIVHETIPEGGAQNYDKSTSGALVPVVINAQVSTSDGIYKTGWGTVILNNIGDFAGSINVEQGRLHIGEGTLVNLGAGNNLTIGTTSGGGGQFIINGGTFSTVTNTTIPYATLNVLELRKGKADFSNISTSGEGGGLIRVSGGAFTAGDVMIGRTSGNTGDWSHGFIVNGGTATVANLGIATNNSWACGTVDGGKLIVTGALSVGWQATGTRGGQFRVIGGGELVAGEIILSRANNNRTMFDITDGLVTAQGLTLGADAVSSGTAILTLDGATAALYIGEKGITKPGSFTTVINLTNGILGADGDWSTTAPMTVTGTGSITIKAASAAGVAHDITLGGALGNSGAITKTGGGTLTLSAVNTHTGPITVNEGTLNVTGHIATSTEVVTINVGATLAGTGTISRPVVLNGSKLVASAAPLTVVSLTKQGTDKVPVIYAPVPAGTGSSRTPVVIFTSSNLTNADFEPIVEDDRLIYMDVTATGIDQVVYVFAEAGNDSGVTGGDDSGMTGGGDAPPIMPTDAAIFKAAIENAAAAVVIVRGEIDLTTVGAVTVASNKTIIGQSADATIKGTLTLPATTSNVVIDGVNITNPAGNGLVLDGAQDVYITQCTFYDCNGTLVSAINGADNITLSWNEFYYTSGFTGTRSAMKIGAAGTETKPLRAVLHHNYFGEGCAADMPATNYGHVHMYANYLHAPGNTTATIVGDLSQVLSERNVYQDMADPIAKTELGLLAAAGNAYGTGTAVAGDDKVFAPNYQYVLETVAAVASRVSEYVGNTGGAGSVMPATVDVTVSILASGAAVPEGGTFMLAASVVGAVPVSYQWNLDSNAVDGATGDTYTVTNAKAGLHAGTYSVSIVLGTGETIVSAGSDIQIGASNPPVIVTQPIVQNVRLNDRAVFAVIATSNTPLTYQWYKDGVMIPFATQSSYYQHATLAYNGGVYTVVVTNATGSKTSDGAMLNIVDLPATNSGGGDDSGDGGGGGAPSWWLLGAGALLMVIRYARKIRGAACLGALLIAGLFATTPGAQAADGTWSGGNGNWSDAGNWSGGAAGGIDSTATFSGAGGTVTVNAPVTVGNIAFSSDSWTIASSGAGNALTLEVSTSAPEENPFVSPVIDAPAGTTLTITGTLTGTQGFTKTGSGGTIVVAGTTTINGHILMSSPQRSTSGTMSIVSGGYLNLGAGNFRILGGWSDAVGYPALEIDGGTFITTGIVLTGAGGAIAPRPSTYTSGTSMNRMVIRSGYVRIGEFRTASDSRGTLLITGGTLIADYINIERSGGSFAEVAYGFLAEGGYVEAERIGIATGNSHGSMTVRNSGTVLVRGDFTVSFQASSTRGGTLIVEGGRLTSLDTVNGLILGRQNGTTTNTQTKLLISGGVTTLEKITLGYDDTMATGTFTGTLSGGALYLGTGGIVKNGASGFNTTITLSGGTLGAKGSWSTTHPVAISGAVTILASSEDGMPNDITFGGAVSGAGALTKGGAGALTLSAANTHTGAITVNSGTLVITNGLGASADEVTISTGVTLDASGANLARPVVLAGGSSLVLNGTPMAVTSLAKTGTGYIRVIFNGTFSDKLTIATFDTTNLVNADFDPITLPNGSQVFVKVSEDRLELVTTLITVPNLPDDITGSDGAEPVLVTTAPELKAALASPVPATVYVDGTIALPSEDGIINIGSDKTIVGQTDAAVITGQLTLSATSSNVILYGVTITNPTGNGLVIDGAKNVYVTHCTIYDCDGALVSAINGADNVTFAWNKFYYTDGFAGTGARSVMKIGAAGAETTPLHVVLHHNYFGEGCAADMPASTNGYIHMYDNYLNAPASTTATIVAANSQLLSEGNVYQNMAAPIVKQSGGLLRIIGNLYPDTSDAPQGGEDIVFVPDYPRVLETANTIGTNVPLYAGNSDGVASDAPDAFVDVEAVIMATGTTVPTGGGFTLIASVPGYQPQSYQWYLNNLPIPGATNSGYSVSDATTIESGPYSVGMTLATGETIISGATRVTVGAGHRPDIVMQPASIVVARQDTALFTVVATGDGEMRYQWQKNGADIVGATTSLLSLPNVQDADAATYQVIVANDYGRTESDAATLTLRGGSGGGEISGGGGGGGAPSWWLPVAMLALASLRAMTTRRRQTR